MVTLDPAYYMLWCYAFHSNKPKHTIYPGLFIDVFSMYIMVLFRKPALAHIISFIELSYKTYLYRFRSSQSVLLREVCRNLPLTVYMLA